MILIFVSFSDYTMRVIVDAGDRAGPAPVAKEAGDLPGGVRDPGAGAAGRCQGAPEEARRTGDEPQAGRQGEKCPHPRAHRTEPEAHGSDQRGDHLSVKH